MTFSEMKLHTLLLLGTNTYTNAGVTEAEVEACINRALPEVGANVEDLLTYCEYDTVAATQDYSVPQYYLTVKQLILQSNTNTWEEMVLLDLPQWNKTTYGMSTHQGVPEFFKIERWATEISNDPQIPGNISFWPIPDAAYPFRLYYYQRPTSLTLGTDISELPIHWHMLPCYKAAEWLAIKKKDFELARMMERKYAMGVTDAKQLALRPQRARSNYTKDEMGYGDLD